MPKTIKPGDVWTYHNRPHEPNSVICVIAIDDGGPTLGTIVSVAIDHVAIPNPHIEGGLQELILHVPIRAATLKQALDVRIDDDWPNRQHPLFQDAYQTWRAAFKANEAGAFSISPVEILDLLQASIPEV